MDLFKEPEKYNIELEYYEISLIQDSLRKQIEYIKQCDFEKEYKPLDFTREDAIEMFEKLDQKLWNIVLKGK